MTLKISRPIHPGEYLREEYLKPLDMSAGQLAKKLNLPRTRIERIVTEQMGITPDTAFRLAKLFDTSPDFWMNFQTSYELAIAAGDKALRKELAAIRPMEHAAS